MKIDNGTIVAVVDGEKLLIFRNEGDSKFPVLTTVEHEETGNGPTRDLGSDAPGRVHSSMGAARSSYGDTDWHDKAEADFARHAATVIEAHAAAQADAGIVVIAAPRTLGELRQHYGRATSAGLAGEIDKELTHASTDHIAEVIAAHES